MSIENAILGTEKLIFPVVATQASATFKVQLDQTNFQVCDITCSLFPIGAIQQAGSTDKENPLKFNDFH